MGGSDEGTQFVLAGGLRALFHDIGFEVIAERFAKGCPGQSTIAHAEFKLAADTLVKVLREIADDEAPSVGILLDHGHRWYQDHFVVLFMWAGMRNGRRSFKCFCASIDRAGHKTKEAANAIKRSL